MATFTLWIGTRSPAHSEYKFVEVEGEEVFTVSFDDGDPPVDYRVFEAPGAFIVYYIERKDGVEVGGIDVYESLADFLLKELP